MTADSRRESRLETCCRLERCHSGGSPVPRIHPPRVCLAKWNSARPTSRHSIPEARWWALRNSTRPPPRSPCRIGPIGCHHENLVFIKPPFYALLMWPLAQLPFVTAFYLFRVLVLTGVGLFLWLWPGDRWAAAAACAWSVPLAATFTVGQDVIFLLVAALGAYRMLRSGRPFLAGCCSGSAPSSFTCCCCSRCFFCAANSGRRSPAAPPYRPSGWRCASRRRGRLVRQVPRGAGRFARQSLRRQHGEPAGTVRLPLSLDPARGGTGRARCAAT